MPELLYFECTKRFIIITDESYAHFLNQDRWKTSEHQAWNAEEKLILYQDNTLDRKRASAMIKFKVRWSNHFFTRFDLLWLSSFPRSREISGWKTSWNAWRDHNSGRGIIRRCSRISLLGWNRFLRDKSH